ncbi:hypothetical protein SAMN05421640_0571 [Ekhidna lutea]|uniref:Outer membrane protein assembly factor BamA n=1 Tax=Ekhidna lutea TaxID=447679 RepID=A0A239F9Z6_EKHLU|nr:hypothetical protein [Ekhidna lutea]SNS53719.1 hypothetical protein SAMN05421640_0571 [Ekhidna lutea]
MQRIFILLFFINGIGLHAQVPSQIFVDNERKENRSFKDTLDLVTHIRKYQIDWLDRGYFFTGVDSVNSGDTVNIYLHKGDKYTYKSSELGRSRLHGKLKNVLIDHINNGYPFASIRLDSIQMVESTLMPKVSINTGPLIRYDSAFLFKDITTDRGYMYKLLDIVPEDRFSERNYRSIQKKMRRTSILHLDRPTDISFKNEKATVFLDISENESNSFQGVLGLQQVDAGNTVFVGNLALDIQNLFKSGKQFQFTWERFSAESQQLDIYYKHPFILESSISPSFNLNILKQDTTFLTRTLALGLYTYISPSSELHLEYEQTNGTLLSTDLSTIANAGLADFTRTTYGARISSGNIRTLQKLNENVVWNAGMSLGNKKVNRNLNLPDVYYDSIDIETEFYRLNAQIAYQVRILRKQAFYNDIDVGMLINDQLLTNEMYRRGGLQSLRGFNERSIFAEKYLLSRSEFRSFFEEESYLQVFYDQMLVTGKVHANYLFGFGLGFALATSSGQFSFALAVGNSGGQTSFSEIKVHFGYISRF